MDEELERWAKAWRSMEVKHMNIIQHTQTAHRNEAMWQAVLATGLGLGVVMLALWLPRLAAGELHQRWPLLLVHLLSMALGAWTLWRSKQQAALARARLVATPLGFVTDLIGLRERELAGWIGKRVLLPGCVLIPAIIAIGTIHLARARAAGQPNPVAEGLMGLTLLFLIAFTIFGIRRVRYLRHDLASLREVRAELEPEG